MSLLPSRGPETSTSQEGELEIVGVDEDVSAIIDALSSEMAREILNAVYEEPCTPSELADRLEMSIQKVSYHLEKLEEEELIAVAGTRYSEKGQEMKVYQPPDDPLVLFVGTRDRKRTLRSLARRLVPVVGILTAASVVVQVILGGFPMLAATGGADGGEAGSQSGGAGSDVSIAESTPEPTPTPQATAEPAATPTPSGDGGGVGIAEATQTPTRAPEPTATEVSTEAARQVTTTVAMAGDTGFQIEPGVAFFLGGLLVVAVFVAIWGYETYR